MFDVVKRLNGIGESDDGMMSETWSSIVAKSLFEHEYAEEIDAAIKSGQFNMPSYRIDNDLDLQLKSVAQYMLARSLRKVDREVFVAQLGGFDMHGGDTLNTKFSEVNIALNRFTQYLKNEGLWDDTVIVLGSEFGR